MGGGGHLAYSELIGYPEPSGAIVSPQERDQARGRSFPACHGRGPNTMTPVKGSSRPVVCYTDVGGEFTDCFVVDEAGDFVIGKARAHLGRWLRGSLSRWVSRETRLA